jgi:multicomponent Na+:H+ antiporter subunit A
LISLIAAHFIAAAMSPTLVRVLRRRAFLALAIVPLITFVWVLGQTREVRAGEAPVEVVSWVPTWAWIWHSGWMRCSGCSR